ncbi:hypothetical protein N8377_01620 [Flavobacteriaceae bacterium]|nr:hypothetical protein [Flavobacteriaceae bacterium]
MSPNATGTYDAGNQIGLTATPNQGYSFVRWSERIEIIVHVECQAQGSVELLSQ